MEIGHNVMHGQWDWMNDPQIHSSTWDWDTASTAEAWKHSHNYVHHTFTNIRGKDKDLGYEIMRIDPHQKWHPVYLFQPLYNLVLMALFEWGVAFHDMDLEALRAGEKTKEDVVEDLKGIGGKARDQIVKDYVGWPAISALAAGATDFVVRRDKDKALKRARDTFKKAAAGQRHRERRAQPVVARDHLLWALSGPDLHLQPGGDRGREPRGLVRPPAHGRGEHRGRPVLPRDVGQPRLPGRAPPVPRHALEPLRADRAAGQGHLRAVRAALQHGAVLPAMGHGQPHDRRGSLFRAARRAPSPGLTRGDEDASRTSANGASRNGASANGDGKVRDREPAAKGASEAGPEQPEDGVKVDPPERSE